MIPPSAVRRGLPVAATIACLFVMPATAQVVLPPGMGQVAGGQTVPTAAYDLALQGLLALAARE